ncbi:MAG: glutathione S-transferase family protein [Hyphomonadaceae bacterium]
MSGGYRLFGSESSAYSTKLRTFLTYKGVEFAWTPRTQDTEDELQSLARFPTLPVLVTPGGFAVHDTTPLIEALEADSPEPSATPSDPALGFLSCVLEEYADSWLTKAVNHYRWTRKKDQRAAAQRAIEEYCTREAPQDRKAAEDVAIDRMTAEMKRVGLEGEFGAAVEKSFKRFVKLLDAHLQKHAFLFGGQPTIADFAVGAQLAQTLRDPTPAKILEKDGAAIVKWCEALAEAKPAGPFEDLDALRDTLEPIFRDELAAAFLPWAAENLETSLAGGESFEVTIGKDAFTLAPLRSTARSFRELRRKFVSAQEIETLRAFTDAAGATVFLQRPQSVQQAPAETEAGDDAADENGSDAPAAEAAEANGEASGEERTGRRRRRRGRRGRSDAASQETADQEASGEDGAGEDGAVEEASGDDSAGDDVDPAIEAAVEPEAEATAEPAVEPEAETSVEPVAAVEAVVDEAPEPEASAEVAVAEDAPAEGAAAEDDQDEPAKPTEG